ncbi:ATP-binding protein [Desulfoluna butyratoxydans]|uniref:Histidine kinase- dna gyrase b- and hsp90-like atpase n=1 Tax=Desulfoluna butyratoxydans TaxID=231438 RepID=A0A4U8YN14_9BACT|nr:ATP-binding protein [Desulfoluna butyratoxydans]VFQ44927.1 histidine kinase- dna gyrase b- and hsp90-like atpase [Desulfoluna butyratoxydans]
MNRLRRTYAVRYGDFNHAGEASIHVKNTLKSLNFRPELVRRVSICGYEAEMNLVMHGGDGVLKVVISPQEIRLDVEDSGPGIENTELAMQEGYSTASDAFREMGFGAGMGLPNMKRNSDDIVVDSVPGRGTAVTMRFTVGGGEP